MCACALVGNSVRAGTSRGDPYEWNGYGLRVTCVYLLCCMKGERQVLHVSLKVQLADVLNHKPVVFFLLLFLCPPLSLCPLLLLDCASSSIFFLSEEKHSLLFFPCLSGSFLSCVVCGGSMERHLLAPRQIPDYTLQLRL